MERSQQTLQQLGNSCKSMLMTRTIQILYKGHIQIKRRNMALLAVRIKVRSEISLKNFKNNPLMFLNDAILKRIINLCYSIFSTLPPSSKSIIYFHSLYSSHFPFTTWREKPTTDQKKTSVQHFTASSHFTWQKTMP